MLKILTTSGLSNKIEEIISEAKDYIVLVTPYLRMTQSLMGRLIQADEKNIKILILYGKNEISDEQKESFKKLSNCNLYFLKDLHAKCYLNESCGIISSLNLYEYSQINNWDLGVYYDTEDTRQQDQLYKEIDLMFDNAVVKIEKFPRIKMVKKSIAERFTPYLNEYFKTDKFKYSKIFDEFSNNYQESIKAISFPTEQINIELLNHITRVDFTVNLTEQQTEVFVSRSKLKEFEDEYRVYHNKPGTISLYISLFHREKWYTYTDKFKFEYLTKSIIKMNNYIMKIIDEIINYHQSNNIVNVEPNKKIAS